MNILTGIENFLNFVNENWTTICVCIGLLIGIIQKIKKFMEKSNEAKIEYAKERIRETMLKMVSEAELNWEDWSKAGSIKRSEVIDEIFIMYPILEKVVDKAELINWIDSEIDKALVTLRAVIAENK